MDTFISRTDIDTEHILKKEIGCSKVTIMFAKEPSPDTENTIINMLMSSYENRMRLLQNNIVN